MTSIETLLYALVEIRKYIIKLSKTKRKSEVGQKKLLEAQDLHKIYLEELENDLDRYRENKISNEEWQLLSDIYNKFGTIYKEIQELCDTKSVSDSESEQPNTMASFDLKTACSLLPIMTGDEMVTLQLIDNIELYETMLKDDQKQNLVQFVLKSRLSNNAKLRLSQKYDTVAELIKDMKKQLLTQKSATSLQMQLNSLKQSSRSIEKFGSEIENLFVNLTISQSDGKPEAYEILRPINEKLAIKRFTDGLRDTRLGTIIAAHNYTSLKDAIRAAKDEELSTIPSTSGVAYTMQRGINRQGRGRCSMVRPSHSHNTRVYTNSGTRGNNSQGYKHNYGTHPSTTRYQSRGNHQGRYNNPQRGKFYRGRPIQGIRHMTTEYQPRDSQVNEQQPEGINMNHFFRA